MANSTNIVKKNSLRLQAKSKVKQLSSNQRELYSKKIVSHLGEFIISKFSDQQIYIGIYAATAYEPHLHILNQSLPSTRLCYPLCEEDSSMRFFHVNDTATLVSGKFGIQEPSPESHAEIPSEQLSIICCPAWAFSPTGERLGKGGGYYDRYLTKNSAYRIGIAYSCQIFDQIAVDPHDIAMETVITEQKIIHSL